MNHATLLLPKADHNTRPLFLLILVLLCLVLLFPLSSTAAQRQRTSSPQDVTVQSQESTLQSSSDTSDEPSGEPSTEPTPSPSASVDRSRDFDLRLHTRSYSFPSSDVIAQISPVPFHKYFQAILPPILYNASIPVAYGCRLIPNFKRIPDNQRPPYLLLHRNHIHENHHHDRKTASSTSTSTSTSGGNLAGAAIAAPVTCDPSQDDCTHAATVTVVTAASGLSEVRSSLPPLLSSWTDYVSVTVRITVHELPELVTWLREQDENHPHLWDKTMVHLLLVASSSSSSSSSGSRNGAKDGNGTMTMMMMRMTNTTTPIPPLTKSAIGDALLYRSAFDAALTDLVWVLPIGVLPSAQAAKRLFMMMTQSNINNNQDDDHQHYQSWANTLMFTRTALVFHTLQCNVNNSAQNVHANIEKLGAQFDTKAVMVPYNKAKLFRNDVLTELAPFSRIEDRQTWIASQTPYVVTNLDENAGLHVLLSKRSGAVPKIINRAFTVSRSSLIFWFATLVKAGYTFYKESSVFLVTSSHPNNINNIFNQPTHNDISTTRLVVQSNYRYRGDTIDTKFFFEAFNPKSNKNKWAFKFKGGSTWVGTHKFKHCPSMLILQRDENLPFFSCEKHSYADITTIAKESLWLDKGLWLYTNFIMSKSLIFRHDVTMNLHIGETKYLLLKILAETWPGPVSCAVYIADQYQSISNFTDFILENQVIFHKWSFHLVVHQSHAKPLYPHNLLRNIAMDSTRTDFSFSIDVDFIPTHTLYDYFLALTQDEYWGIVARHEKSLFIPPAFEIDRRDDETEVDMFKRLPKTKKALIKRLGFKTKDVRYFHKNFAAQGHKPTEFARWMNGREKNNIYSVKYKDKFEPYFLVEKGYNFVLPRFDPIFRGFGKNKFSWVLELAAANYNFYVIPWDFLVHLNHEISRAHYRSVDSVMRQFYCALTHTYGSSLPWRRELLFKKLNESEKQRIQFRYEKIKSQCTNKELTFIQACHDECFSDCFRTFCNLEEL